MRPLLTLVFLLVTRGAVSAAEPLIEQSFESHLSRAVGYRYLLHVPAGAEADPDRRWPVLLFLHGAGERGDDLWRVAIHGPPKLLRGTGPLTEAETAAARVLAENFIVVAPQCPAGASWDDEAVLALLDAVQAKQKVDPARVYLTGLSMGGYGTWSLASRYPERFAAVVPICGGGQTISLLLATNEKKAALRTLGFRVFHGARDPTVPVNESERLVALLKRGGVTDLELTIYPEARHDSWTETYANAELYTWLLRHERR
ncbi:MAG TPA: prolyl oligopeptidase family serine peptidase [Opitutaceae bacterium]|nr:prolyl oligopeptidase family serine peptidase [Opitutaceae bacterium]